MTELQKPKLAIFDLGNVIFRVDWHPMFETWSQASGVAADELQNRFQFDGNFEDFERGLVSPQTFHEKLCSSLNAQFSYDEFVRGWNAIYQEAIEETGLTLEQIQGKIRIVAFTNTNEVHCLIWPERYREILSQFEEVFISSKMKLRKPEAEGFRHVLERCGVTPGEVVFFDDFAPNIEAARSLGIRAVLVDTPRAIATALLELGILEEKR